jgi:transcriptional regulator with XRE-family HTH domain
MKVNRLRLKRLEKGITQFSLHYRTKIPQSYISLAENGYPTLKRHHMEKIAKVLGASVEEIFPTEQK